MNSVKVGIIGIGNMGTAHLQCVYNNGITGMSVTAVCDIEKERLEFVKSKYPDIALYDNADDMIKNSGVDAVVIAVPHRFHADIAVTAFENGLHVLTEKPADISVTKAKELNAAAEKSGKVFAIMFNQRTNQLFKKARAIVKSGELGELKRSVWVVTNWYRTQHYYDSGSWRATWDGEGGGVLLNQAPHNLDIWQWICGMPESVTAFCNIAKFHNIEVEDEAIVYAKYKNGATGVFITSTGDYPGTNRLEISGTLGKLVLESGILKQWRLNEDERKICYESNDSFPVLKTDCSEYHETETETAHKGILQNFTNAILNGEELISPGTDGINELTISNAAYLSEWKGNVAVSLPFDNCEFDRLLASRAEMSEKQKKHIQAPDSGEYNTRWKVRW